MITPGRKFSAGSSYRYGFNGKEKDANITVENYDFGARIYDGRLGRWLSVDPKQKEYSNLSPYNGMGNNPILFIDPNGETIIINSQNQADLIKVVTYISVLAGSKDGNKYLTKLHESNTNYIIKTHSGVKDQFSFSNRQGKMSFDPNEALSYKKGYREYALFSFAHEIRHAYEAEMGNYSGKGVSEGRAVNAENNLRSVLGFLGMRKSYDFSWWENNMENASEHFNDYLEDNPNKTGERMSNVTTKVLSPIKTDSKATYSIVAVGTYNANAKEITEAKEGIITYFDYQKDKDSKIEKKATLVIIQYSNEEKK